MSQKAIHSYSSKALAGALTIALVLVGCPPLPDGAPMAGMYDYQRKGYVAFRHGLVNTLGGNLVVPRVDLSIDTLLGTVEIGATYNSATSEWTWSFDEEFKDDVFIDASGAVHESLDLLEEGDALPGTTWVKSSPLRIKSKGGFVRHFQGVSGRLRWMYWGDASGVTHYPRLEFTQSYIGGSMRITSVRQCSTSFVCDDVYSVSYDAAGRVAEIEDRAGRRAEFTWAGSNLVSARDGLDVEESRAGWSYEYDLSHRLTAMTNGEGERTEFAYNASGQVTEVRSVGEGDPTKTFFYEDKVDGLYTTRYWDENEVEHRYVYDAFHRLVEIENVPLSESHLWTYSSGLRPASTTDVGNLVTILTWSDDNLVTEVTPAGNVIDYTYEPLGIDRRNEVTSLFEQGLANPGHRPLLRAEDSIGLIEERTYDAEGQLVSITRGEGRSADTTTFGYADGLVASVTWPNGVETTLSDFGWDGHARNITTVGSSIPQQSRSFDLVGNRTNGAAFGLPEEGAVQARIYDADRNVRVIQLEDGSSISIDVRADGQQTRILRPSNDTHEFDYDDLGRLVARRERVSGEWQTTNFELDGKGRRIALERPNGMRTETQFDDADRPVAVTNLRALAVESYTTMDYAGGLLASRFDSVRNTTETYGYDSGGRLESIDHGDGRSTERFIDLRGRKVWQSYAEGGFAYIGGQFTYAYDAADRLGWIEGDATRYIEHTYLDGRLVETAYGNGLIREYTYS